MELVVSDVTYEKFSKDFPGISKWELQSILMRVRMFSEYDYWNHFQTFDSLAYGESRKKNLYFVERKTYLFFVHSFDIQLYKLPSVIELKPNNEGEVYKIYE
ncbi:hypothetical protein [Planomicrobium sp. MB-3u-38]|uniref:hypothetical protein n=1 Tax=Planomicrobium sp. MB-3u-38 TaxID=2058318 RepID=UPI000C7993B4|nr:hypothetical protein [Planomicrobium sp. MB-3u-38]PKH09843.1 hypothetical protein CXF70_11550 [Planomicrobium sp. MB-3u-38]